MTSFIKAAVIGHPVSHSKSPLIHGHWIEHYGLSGSYEAIDLAPECFESGIRQLVAAGYKGFNFTVPHKEQALALCDSLTPAAKAIGAVNTLVVEADGSLTGHNTDSYGFLTNITGHAQDFNFIGKTAIILGAGGAARAALYGLWEQKIGRILLINRTQGKAQKLADAFSGLAGNTVLQVIPWEERAQALAQADLLVNTTTLGMQGQPPLDLDLSALPLTALVNDIVYVPLMTDLLKNAAARGNPVVTGIGMLLHQARPAFALWFGVLPEVTEELEALVLS